MPIAAVALALIALWLLAITMLGGQEKASSEAPPAATTERKEKVAHSAEAGADAGGGSTTVTNTEDGATGSASDAGPGSEEPEAVEVERRRPAAEPVAKKSVGQIIPEDASTHNPLGKEIDPNDLTETQRGRVELAASQFVIRAYGFTGKGKEASMDYEAGLSHSVVAPVFYESPGAVVLAELAGQIESEGVRATAYLESFDVSRTAPESVGGTARFTVESDAATKSYTQDFLLENSGAIWRVKEVGEIQGGGQ